LLNNPSLSVDGKSELEALVLFWEEDAYVVSISEAIGKMDIAKQPKTTRDNVIIMKVEHDLRESSIS
jgi:hypothetical protein